MRYIDGQEVRLRDRVCLGDDPHGIVVALIDLSLYDEGFSEDSWSYLERGALVNFPLFGLIHDEEMEPDLTLVERVLVGQDVRSNTANELWALPR
jgi:hypothetical protein